MSLGKDGGRNDGHQLVVRKSRSYYITHTERERERERENARRNPLCFFFCIAASFSDREAVPGVLHTEKTTIL